MTDALPDIVVTGVPILRAPDQLTLIASGQEIEVWTDIAVTLRAEGFPNSFNATMAAPATLTLKAGDSCTVLLGRDKVITGYIDRVSETGSPGAHQIDITGRGQTQDLVDCGAEWPHGQMIGGDALTIASRLALPYGIAVALGEGADAGPVVPSWALNYGETGAAIVQRVARNAGLLAYERPDGSLVLARAGTRTAASGARYGDNVQAWSAESSMDGRFSEIVCASMSMDTLIDLGGDEFFHAEQDPNVPRHRRMYLVLESVAEDPQAFTVRKAQWEVARRAGRSKVVQATLDSWRDKEGRLWEPNTLVPVEVPGNAGGTPLVVSEVTFRRSGATGTVADLVLMPKEAFALEPINLQPVNTADIAPPPVDAAPGSN